MEQAARNPIKSVRTTLSIAETLVECDGASVTELADRLSFTKGTVHNHLATLREGGYVVEENGTYHVGPRFLYPAIHARDRNPLYEAAKSAVDELAGTTGERVDLVTKQDTHTILIYTTCGDQYTKQRGVVGSRLPLYCTAAGKAILAYTDDVDYDVLLSDADARTERTLTESEKLEEEEKKIRDSGLAFDNGEFDGDIRGIAAPLFHTQKICGAVSVLGSADRFHGKTFQQDIPGLVISTAERINSHLDDI